MTSHLRALAFSAIYNGFPQKERQGRRPGIELLSLVTPPGDSHSSASAEFLGMILKKIVESCLGLCISQILSVLSNCIARWIAPSHFRNRADR
jgi:hypothetical protein